MSALVLRAWCPVVEDRTWTDRHGIVRLKQACQNIATQAVTAYHRNGAPETVFLCAHHAQLVRRQIAAAGRDRPPRSWLANTPKPSPACVDCGRRADQGVSFAAGGRCWSCYRQHKAAS